jgi:adenine-specific DNA-methyltransferase
VKHDATMQKLTAADPETHSPDLVAENLAALQALFPDLITEGPDGVAVNIDVLKALVGDKTVSDADEKYGLNWHGKRRARQLALTPSTGTLRPCPDDSVDWDTTQNLMIEGDNLEVLKLLQKSYAGKIKLIYIDPPYNTGKDFVYPDNFQDNIKNYLELTGQTGEGGKKLSSNTESSGRFHTDWLNMMYPRLKLARNLLRDDGVIFISIDDSEAAHVISICCEVFGEENFVSSVIWQKKYAKQNDSKTLSTSHDYVLLFTKNLEVWAPGKLQRGEEQLTGYKNPDNDTRGRWQSVVYTCNKSKSERPNLFYPITNPFTGRECLPDESRVWAYDRQRTEKNIQEGRLWWGTNGELEKPRMKSFLSEVGAGIVPDTLWFREDVGDTQDSAREIASLFGESVFSTPKPIRLLQRCIQVANCSESDLVLDFFAGSGTTGHAVCQTNALDGTFLRYILVQLPELLDLENRDQQVAARFCANLGKPLTIAELTKERLRRAATKIREKNPLFAGDLGFRVFNLSSSNIKTWDPDSDKIAETLQASIEHLKTDRTEQDILFELLLKLGLDLCVPIEIKRLEGSAKQVHDIHSIGGGSLLVCLSKSIPQADVEPLALTLVAWHQELEPAGDTTVVFRDSAFADDVAKTNITAILQQHGLETVRCL